MACSCSKKAQPTGFAKTSTASSSTETLSAQSIQRSGAARVPGAVSAPLRSVKPSAS